jgi:CrcB protein
VATLVMLLGGFLGLALRSTLDPARAAEQPGFRWQPLAVSVIGGFVLGALTGAALLGVHSDSALATAGIGLSAALTTYCLFGSATTSLVRNGVARQTVIPALTLVVSGFGAATVGVALGAVLVS